MRYTAGPLDFRPETCGPIRGPLGRRFFILLFKGVFLLHGHKKKKLICHVRVNSASSTTPVAARGAPYHPSPPARAHQTPPDPSVMAASAARALSVSGASVPLPLSARGRQQPSPSRVALPARAPPAVHQGLRLLSVGPRPARLPPRARGRSVRCLAALSPEMRATLDKVVGSSKVVLFMKGTRDFPQCGFSHTVVQILRSLDVPFETLDVLANEALRQGLKEYSSWPTFPQLYIDGEFFGGCDITVGTTHSRPHFHLPSLRNSCCFFFRKGPMVLEYQRWRFYH